ncbi:putative ATP-dependent RNA helicase DBP7-like isoform X1 [Capsicum annuum]|nr:putative ATP-dependent RNA helicase DBP7-like isoform X1 [Capsicum annuum]
MEILNLKDSVEKDTFFRKLPNLAEQLPREIVLKKLLPLLASALEFGSAAAPALTALLKMGSWLSTDEFSVKVLPTIVKLFASNDRSIRVALLQHIDQYGESLSAKIVDEQVYPHVATGFSDTSAFLREMTLKSMLVLAPKLSQRTISGSLLKYLSKLQVDEEPAIRTNTTILLGNIAGYLNEGTRKRVLINALTVRALRDTFAPARAAGIMALSATSSYYDVTEIATRILPNIVVFTIDPDSDVQSKAFQAVDQFLQLVKQHHEKSHSVPVLVDTRFLPSGLGGQSYSVPVLVGGSSSLNGIGCLSGSKSTFKTSTGDDSSTTSMGTSSIPGNASLLGWAMSSLTLKGSKSSEQGSYAPASSSMAPTSAVPSSSSNSSSIAPIHVSSSSTDLTDQHVPVSPTSNDGWGELENGILGGPDDDKDGWDDIEPQEEPKPSPFLANIQAAQRRPVSQPKPQVTGLRGSMTPKVSKNEDDDLWGSVPATAPAPRASSSQPSSTRSSRTVGDDDDPWGAIAAPAPSAKPLNVKKGGALDDNDPWAAIAAPVPTTTKARPSIGRGRGNKPTVPKLGAQRINRTSSGM